MKPYLVTAPAVEPVSLPEAKAQCRVFHDEDDDLLSGLITTARQWAEAHTHRKFCTQTWDFKFDGLPGSYIPGSPDCWLQFDAYRSALRLEIPYPPAQSVTHVKYLPADGSPEATWDSAQYRVLGLPVTAGVVADDAERAYIVAATGYSWPSVLGVPEALTVRVVLGYGDETKVPQVAKQAILLRLADLYLQRETSVTGTIHKDTGADLALLGPLRSLRVA